MSVAVLVLRIFNYFTAVALITYALFIYVGNGERNWWSMRSFYRQYPGYVEPFYQNAAPVSAPSVAMPTSEQYRGDIQRSGFYPAAPILNLKKSNVEAFRNLGIHGASKSSPVPLDEDIVVTTDVGDLVRINKAGNLQWSFRTTKAREGFHGTPVIYDNMVIAGDYSGLMMALDAQSGKMIWGLPLGNSVGASPLITPDGYIVISVELNWPQGFIAKINPRTGELIWLSRLIGDHGHSSPALLWNEIRPESSIVVFGDNSERFSGIDYKTGEFLWRKKVGGPIKSTPAISGTTAYVSSWDGFLYAIDVPTGVTRWAKNFEEHNQSSVALLAEKKWGFISSRKGLCRFGLDTEEQDIKCTEVKTGKAERKASPIITRGAKGSHIVWTPCKTNFICAYSENLQLLREWNVGEGVSGEIRPYKNGLIAMTQGESGLIFLLP